MMNTSKHFSVDSEQLGDTILLHLHGYLDAFTAPLLEAEFTKHISNNDYKFIADFSDVEYIGSAGLGVFMMFIEEIRNNKGDIKFAAMQSTVFTVFDLLGFPMIYSIVDTIEEAKNLFDSKQ